MSRPWKSVPSGVPRLPPSIQKGGANIGASFTGNVGSYGARRSASSATRISPPRMATGARGASRVSLTIARSAPDVARRDGNRESAGMVAIAICPTSRRSDSSREADSRVDEGVHDVHEEIDPDDHEARHDDHAL